MRTGIIKAMPQERKMGFIVDDTTNKEFPFWFKHLSDGYENYKKGDRVSFDTPYDSAPTNAATNIKHLEE